MQLDGLLPQEVAEEMGSEELTIKEAILQLRDDLGYGAIKISSWFTARDINVTEGSVSQFLKASGKYDGKEKATDPEMCECCKRRKKHPGFRKLCLACYRTEDSDVMSEHSLMTQGRQQAHDSPSTKQKITAGVSCKTGLKDLRG